MASDLKLKTNKAITECAERLQNYFKQYNKAVEEGQQHIALLVAHKTTMKSIKSSNIETTETYESDPDIKLNLNFNLRCNINLEEEALELILNQLDTIFYSIMKECDKVSRIDQNAKDMGMSFDDLTQGEVNQYPICKKVEKFDTFEKRFNDSHLTRKYCLSYLNSGGDVNKLPNLWDLSKIQRIQNNLLDVALK